MSQTIHQRMTYYIETFKSIAKLISDTLIDAFAYTQAILYNFFFKISRFVNLAWSNFAQSLTAASRYLTIQAQSIRSIITSLPLPYQAVIGVITLIAVTWMIIRPALQIIKPWGQKLLAKLKRLFYTITHLLRSNEKHKSPVQAQRSSRETATHRTSLENVKFRKISKIMW